MRILHVFKDYFPPTHGGIEHLVHDITHRMPDVDFSVVTSSRSRQLTEEDDDGVYVVRVPEYGRIGSAPIAPGVAKHIRRLSPDLIHFHMPNPTAELAFVAASIDIPSVASYHAEVARAPWLIRPYHVLQRRFLARMRMITVSSAAMAARTRTLSRFRRKISLVPYGVEPSEWEQGTAAADDIRSRHPGPLVLFTGRLVHYKGVDHLIEAMRLVDATLLVVGSGGELAMLRTAAQRAGLRDRVVFCGGVENADRAAYYHAADVAVLPSTSRSEGFGIVLLEAMASGTPVVSTELGSGTSWANLDGTTGFVVPPKNPGALARAINELLRDPTLAATMGANARSRVHEHFTMSRMIGTMRDVYDRALEGVNHTGRRRYRRLLARREST